MVALVILQAGDEGGHEDEQGIIKNMIEKPLKPPARYYNCVASISNSWRATGNPKVVEDAAAQEHGAGLARKFFSKAPGRCLRARWLSVEAVEKTIANGANLIGTVWSRLWGHTLPEGVPGARPAVEKNPRGLGRGRGRGRGREGKGRGRATSMGRGRGRGRSGRGGRKRGHAELSKDEDEAFKAAGRRMRAISTICLNMWLRMCLRDNRKRVTSEQVTSEQVTSERVTSETVNSEHVTSET